ncbi:MAG: hypothetical protein JW839_21040 [Candidatus Lokiarchaeota archaeon]|nr:hypothetical protein [Candidatus Lokiarchaeota archaeon]
MDEETSRSMRLAMLATAASFVVSLVAYAMMAAFSPISTYADYDAFIRVLIVAMMIQFIVMPVLLTFFVNDAGELENFTREGPLEKAWLVNSIGVLAMIIAGALLGLALAEFYTGWSAIDPGTVFGQALATMTWGMLLQAAGFGVPVFYFLYSKSLARSMIPFKKDELASDKIGIVLSIAMLLPPATLVAAPVFGTLVAGLLGIASNAIGVVWITAYFMAIRRRELPDVPEDSD